MKPGKRRVVDNPDGRVVLRDPAVQKLKRGATQDFKIGFVERPSPDRGTGPAEPTKQRRRQGGNKHIIGIDLDSPRAATGVRQRDGSKVDRLPAINPYEPTRYKNKDETPQEVEEVNGQEEQSQGRPMQPINFNPETAARDDNGSDH